MKRFFPILTLSLVIMLASCAKDQPADNRQSRDSGTIKFDVTNEVQDKAVTRGTPVTDVSQLTTAGVFCSFTGINDWTASDASGKMFNQQINNNSGAWGYPDGQNVYWEASDLTHRYSFFAYAPYASGDNGITVNGSQSTAGVPTLTYTVPADVTKQPDLMVAVPRKNMRPTGAAVPLHMKHALTSVGFQIAGDDEKVKGVAITGVSVTGMLAVDGETITWSNLGAATTTDFSASINYDSGQNYYTATSAMSANLIAGDGYLMMIPQTLGSNAKIVVTYDNNTKSEINLNTQVWTPGKKVDYHVTIVPSVTVTPGNMTLPYKAITSVTDNISVICKTAAGNPAPELAWTLTSNTSWLRLTLSSDGSGAATTVSGKGSQTVYTVADENTNTGASRTAGIILNGTTNVVNVTQLKKVDIGTISGGGTVLPNSYVGAFWRATQRGERVINVNMGTTDLGAWSASVVWTDGRWSNGDIKLAGGLGSSGTILYTGNPGDAESYPVEGDATAVSGSVAANGKIIFRIGLKTTYSWSSTYPARYAVVLLSYNNNSKHQILFIRQGHEPDYLMRTTDTGTGLTSRPSAAKFSPYNLTAAAFKSNSKSQYINVGYKGGVMTDYPTQAGAFFQWAQNNVIVAYSPFNPDNATTPTGFHTSNTVTSYWDAIKGTYESCPLGYRRPTDGLTGSAQNMNISYNSEMFQSLLLNPPISINEDYGDNSVWGFYADGFFDRWAIGLQPSYGNNSKPNSAVNIGTSTVAYNGRLFFNRNNNASLFFPAPGYRAANYGYLSYSGNEGFYWTSSSHSEDNSFYMYFNNNNIRRASGSRTGGLFIRCVVGN